MRSRLKQRLFVLVAPGHGKPADWWSFGVFAFDLLTGRSPFHSHKGKAETKARILRGRFTVPAFLSPDATDLMRRLLRKKAERRLGSRGPHEVKEHAFFADVDWDLVEARAYKPPHVPSFRYVVDKRDVKSSLFGWSYLVTRLPSVPAVILTTRRTFHTSTLDLPRSHRVRAFA